MAVTRRTFLQTVSGTLPTLTFIGQRGTAADDAAPGGRDKFTPLDLRSLFTASPFSFGPRDEARGLSSQSAKDGLIRMPSGKQILRGIPFLLGPGETQAKSWIVLSQAKSLDSVTSCEISVQKKAGFICMALFCDWDPHENPPPNEDVIERVGQQLGEAVLVYQDGQEVSLPLRRRFEVNSPSVSWGHLSFAAVPHRQDGVRRLDDALKNALGWGDLQIGIWDSSYPSNPDLLSHETLWLCALPNPCPEKSVKTLRFRATSQDPLILCAVTLFHGKENPLRYEPIALYRIKLPEASAQESGRWDVTIDLGVVTRTYPSLPFKLEEWLSTPRAGLGERRNKAEPSKYLNVELTASGEATLSLRDTKTGRQYRFHLAAVEPGKDLQAQNQTVSIEILEPQKTFLQGQVLDASSRRPTPVRLAFYSKEGRYIPPYGHRRDVNNAWFQDYGADIKLMDSSFAYVDGTFQIELPVGEVFLEMTKGFEYEGVRRQLHIDPGQQRLDLEISRLVDLRSQGWVSADTHVHFLSPTTAILEGQAEGLNLINLLAAQWGELFTNVGDISHGPLTSRDGETMVWVGTENRQHILGHLGLLGGHGRPAYPMSSGGPEESAIGDPVSTTLAEWADACRRREGLVVAVHFPYPTAELAADIVLGKIDAVELWPMNMSEHFNNLRFLDWYRYLNCGYRLPVVGGTDKMGAWIPAGANRAYAYLGQNEFSFANWARAVRGGNTFVTSGPLIFFQAEGLPPGNEITVRTGGATIEVRAEVTSTVPIHRLDVVLNGRVVSSREESSGTKTLRMTDRIQVSGPGWVAARCASRLDLTGSLRIAAHTSPVYLRIPDQDLFSPDAGAYLLTLIEGAESWVKNLATRPAPDQLTKILGVFTEARDRLHQRMHQMGLKH
ncbi:MAG: CehA/McbA family metallohydrolase [Acidobacteriota bacterium]